MMNCKIYAFANQKGGVGKTTSTCNTGYALAELGYKVLLVDFDPQANLSMCMGIMRPEELEITMPKIIEASMSEDFEMPDKSNYIHSINGIDIIPCNLSLADTEMRLRDDVGGQFALKHILDEYRNDYNFILIDTNPYLGLLTINALIACDEVIIPASPQLWSATGLSDLTALVAKVKKKVNRGITIKGVLFTMCDERTILYKEAVELVKELHESIRIFDTRIPTTVKMGEANYKSSSIFQHSPNSTAAVAYMNFAKEVVA